ncbi:MAG: TonB-dependent receptor [Bacteroidales bacterium]|nr:TonB-dependent receptor [Bacteroidales bacterium]
MKRLTILFAFFVLLSAALQAQGVLITGTVTGADDGSPLPGVSVVVQGTTIGTVTDFEGKYSITVPEASNLLVYSFVGMRTAAVSIDGRSVIDVILEIDAVGIDEVMVVAYGTAKKSSFTGSAENIGSDKIENIQATSISKLLEGATAGIQTTSSSGQPGSDANIRIRGVGSINASSSPLYVVDGVPYKGNLNSINTDDIASITVLKDAAAAALYGSRGANGVIVVTTKRGSSSKMTVQLKVRNAWTSRAMKEYPRLNEQEYYETMWDGYRNSLEYGAGYTAAAADSIASFGYTGAGAPSVDPLNNVVGRLGNYNAYDVSPFDLVGLDGKLNPNANLLYHQDWQDELIGNGYKQDYNLNMNGGDEKSLYYVSLGYVNEDGMLSNSGFERFTARVNAESQVKDWLKVGITTNAAMYEFDEFLDESSYTTNPFYFTRVMGPIYPVNVYETTGPNAGSIALDSEGKPLFDFGSGEMGFPTGLAAPDNMVYGSRPYAGNSNLAASLVLDERGAKVDNVSTRAFAEITILEGLSIRTNMSVDYTGSYRTTYQNPTYGDAAPYGRITKRYDRGFGMTFNQLLNYNKSFGMNSIEVLAGHENYLYRFNRLEATRISFPFPGIKELAPASTGEGSTSYEHNDRIESYLGRVNYNYADRYYISASVRTDGSSRFHPDTRWGTFWSVGGSWRISEESFLQIDWINTLKLKASYGEQGNNDLRDSDGDVQYYPWQGLYDLGVDNNIYSGAIASSLELNSLIWEKNKNFNTGVEFALFNRLRGSFEYFVRSSDNLLFEVPNPLSNGISESWSNIGGMVNRGVEAIISADVVNSDNFRWLIDFNITHYKNEITDLPKEEIIKDTKKLMVGRSVYDFYLRDYVGVDAETGDPLYWIDEIELDGAGDPVLDDDGEPVKTGEKLLTTSASDADRYYVGTSIPKVYGGLTNTFQFAGFDLSVFVTYSLGGDFLDGIYQTLMHEGDYGRNFHADILDRWTGPVSTDGLPSAEDVDGNTRSYVANGIPKVENGNDNINWTSSRFLTDATYVNLRNITLGYTLPENVASRIGAASLRVFGTADNLYIWSQREGMDPQQSFSGNSDYTYVPVKTFTLGLNVTF